MQFLIFLSVRELHQYLLLNWLIFGGASLRFRRRLFRIYLVDLYKVGTVFM